MVNCKLPDSYCMQPVTVYSRIAQPISKSAKGAASFWQTVRLDRSSKDVFGKASDMNTEGVNDFFINVCCLLSSTLSIWLTFLWLEFVYIVSRLLKYLQNLTRNQTSFFSLLCNFLNSGHQHIKCGRARCGVHCWLDCCFHNIPQ